MTDTAQPAQLAPHSFTTETARAAGLKSAEARRARRALETRDATALAQQLDNVRQAFTRHDLGPNAAAVAGQIMSRCLTGDIPVRNGDEAAALLRVLVDVARLEAGAPTALSATLTTAEVVDHIGELQARARAALGATSGPASSATSSTTGSSSTSAAAQAAADPATELGDAASEAGESVDPAGVVEGAAR